MTISDRTSPGSPLAERVPRLWTLWTAARPSQIALVLVVYLLGVGLATAGPPLIAVESAANAPPTPFSSAFLASVLMGVIALIPAAVTIHYANEYADRGTDAMTDRTPFSGGSGALARTGLPASFLRSATVAAFVMTAFLLLGLYLAGLSIDAVGLLVAILVLGVTYSLPPIALIRRGIGEVVNAALGGIALPLYGTAVVASPTPTAMLAVVPFSLVVGCNLLATHWADREADSAVGKRTLAVRWSPERIRRVYATLATVATTVAAGLWVGGAFPDAVVLAHLASVPFLVWGGAVLTRRRSPLPAVLAMVVLAVATTVAWWVVGAGA